MNTSARVDFQATAGTMCHTVSCPISHFKTSLASLKAGPRAARASPALLLGWRPFARPLAWVVHHRVPTTQGCTRSPHNIYTEPRLAQALACLNGPHLGSEPRAVTGTSDSLVDSKSPNRLMTWPSPPFDIPRAFHPW